jgi:hypothetical protein
MINHITKYRFCDQYRRLFSSDQTSNDGEKNMLMLNRRMLLRAGSAAVGATALAPVALARAPQLGKQTQPGFYRFKLDAIEIARVPGGNVVGRPGRGCKKPAHI